MWIECLSSVNQGVVDQLLIEMSIEGRPRVSINSRLWMPLMLMIPEVKSKLFKVMRCFGVTRIRISDPRSVWIMVHQRNW